MIIVWNCDLFQASRRATGREDFSIKVPESPLKKWSIPKQEHLGKPSRSGWEVELITRNRVGVMWSKKSNPDSFKKALVFLVADNWTCFLGIVRNWRCHYSKTLPSDLALWKSFPSFYFCQPRACISQQWPLFLISVRVFVIRSVHCLQIPDPNPKKVLHPFHCVIRSACAF